MATLIASLAARMRFQSAVPVFWAVAAAATAASLAAAAVMVVEVVAADEGLESKMTGKGVRKHMEGKEEGEI